MSLQLPLSLSKDPDVFKIKEVFNNALTSIQRTGRLFSYHCLSLKARTSLKGVDVIRVLSGVTKPLRAYVDPSRDCLYWRFFFVGLLVFVRIQFCVSLFLVYNVRPIKARTCVLRNKVFNEQRHYKGPDVFSKVRLSIQRQGGLFESSIVYSKARRSIYLQRRLFIGKDVFSATTLSF
jgi:hypothetical protein